MDAASPVADAPPRHDAAAPPQPPSAEAIELVEQIQQRFEQLKQIEQRELQREQELAAREADLQRRTEAFHDNLRSAWDQIEQKRALLKQQRRGIGRRFRDLYKRRRLASMVDQPNRRDMDNDRRALAQVKTLLEETEQEMFQRYVGPTALKLAMLAMIAMVVLGGASRWLAHQFVADEARATMVLTMPDGALQDTPLSRDPSLEILSEPPGHATMVYHAATPQDAMTALERIAADLRERNGGGPFAQRADAVRIVQPPTIAQSAERERWRMTAVLFAAGLGVMLLLALIQRIRLGFSPRVLNKRLEHALAVLDPTPNDR